MVQGKSSMFPAGIEVTFSGLPRLTASLRIAFDQSAAVTWATPEIRTHPRELSFPKIVSKSDIVDSLGDHTLTTRIDSKDRNESQNGSDTPFMKAQKAKRTPNALRYARSALEGNDIHFEAIQKQLNELLVRHRNLKKHHLMYELKKLLPPLQKIRANNPCLKASALNPSSKSHPQELFKSDPRTVVGDWLSVVATQSKRPKQSAKHRETLSDSFPEIRQSKIYRKKTDSEDKINISKDSFPSLSKSSLLNK